MIEHSLSALYDIAHGAGLSIIIPGWLRWKSPSAADRISQLGSRIFRIDPRGSQPTPSTIIRKLENWFAKVKSPIRLHEVSIVEDDIPAIAENAMGLAKFWRLEEYTRERIEEILSLCR
jgi:alcohol dehydrogenase YqhD (iron-dependent ADH family)